MIDSVAKAKRDELIMYLQGTPKKPKLKNIREKLLDIKTSIELAEILDITRPTISKLEKCVNKLSGAQYLAICSLIEKKKNEILLMLDDISMDEKEFTRLIRTKLLLMSAFYDISFIFTLIDLEDYKNKKNENGYAKAISRLRELTCLDNWMNTINYNEDVSEHDENKIMEKGDIIIDFSSFDCISDINNMLNKYSKMDSNNKCSLIFLYKDLLNLLDKIQKDVENSIFDEEVLNFVLKISMLIKNRKMEPMIHEEITGYMGLASKEHPLVFIVQNENLAKNIKKDIIYNMKIGKETNQFNRVIEAFIASNAEICKYENGKLKRWLLDCENIRNDVADLSSEEKMCFENRRKKALKINIYTEHEDDIISIDTEEKFHEFLSKQDEYMEEFEKGRKIMAEKLETIIKQILKYISPNV